LQQIEETSEPLPEVRLKFSRDIISMFYNATMPPRIVNAVSLILLTP